jgi:hypothetical protein
MEEVTFLAAAREGSEGFLQRRVCVESRLSRMLPGGVANFLDGLFRGLYRQAILRWREHFRDALFKPSFAPSGYNRPVHIGDRRCGQNIPDRYQFREARS